jgi:phospholipid/cholesterol/gamma-HCH transport system substrate-binding protein
VLSPPVALGAAPSDRQLERRAAVLLLGLALLVCAAVAYLLYARGVFEPTQRVVLLADDSEGVAVGMNLTFSGFAIGRVQRIELADDGSVRILVDVPRKDAHWLRTSSVFTLSRGLVGNTAIRAYSGILTDPALPDGAVRKVLAGDATAEIPKLVSSVRDILQNVSAITAPDAALASTLANAQTMTGKLNGPGGAMGVLMGSPQDAVKVTQALERANTALASVDQLLRRTDGVMQKADGLMGKADAQLFGQGASGPGGGVVGDARAAVQQINGLLVDARGSLKKVDGLLEEAQGAARNARVATTDLGTLRAEVEASLRKVENLLNEVNRKWPLARDTEVKLP